MRQAEPAECTKSYDRTADYRFLSMGNVVSYITAQMIGVIIGSAVVFLHFLLHWKETDDPGAKLGVFATSPAVNRPYASVVSELIETFMLMSGLLIIGANKITDGLNPLIVGFLIIVIGLSLGGITGYAINPARELGPRIAHFLLPIAGKGGSNWKYAWVRWSSRFWARFWQPFL